VLKYFTREVETQKRKLISTTSNQSGTEQRNEIILNFLEKTTVFFKNIFFG
jgi:hypothetical protein